MYGGVSSDSVMWSISVFLLLVLLSLDDIGTPIERMCFFRLKSNWNWGVNIDKYIITRHSTECPQSENDSLLESLSILNEFNIDNIWYITVRKNKTLQTKKLCKTFKIVHYSKALADSSENVSLKMNIWQSKFKGN